MVFHLPADGFSDIGNPVTDASRRGERTAAESDGFSYVEVLVAVVLVGIAVIAALVGLQSTIISSRIGTERSELLLWTQEAAEALHRDPYVQCDAPLPIDSYQATVDLVAPPAGMNGGSLVVDTVRYLSIDPVTFTERWDDVTCDLDFRTAGIRLTATSAEGTTIDHEVIVDG